MTDIVNFSGIVSKSSEGMEREWVTRGNLNVVVLLLNNDDEGSKPFVIYGENEQER